MVAGRGIRAALLAATLVGTALVAPASADLISFFGDERAGTSGGQFLRVPVGARPIALGSGATATVSGPNAIFWNPAALSSQRERHALAINHTEYAADIDINHFAYSMRRSSWQFGVGFGALRSGEIERTTEFHPNGTGQTFDWKIAREAAGLGRLILAGGLTPENVGDAIRQVRPFGVDVSTGLEESPGLKDPELIRAFVAAVRNADRELANDEAAHEADT